MSSRTNDGAEVDVTTLLARWREGDQEALDRLMPIVYAEIHRLAERAMRGERRDHTLQATALVNEAYLRLVGGRMPAWRDRLHFYAVAARLMRRILVDHARGLHCARRGGGAAKLSLDELDGAVETSLVDLLALDEALEDLAAIDQRKARVVELRFFGGLSVDETAELLETSVATVKLDSRLARAWLYERLERSASDGS